MQLEFHQLDRRWEHLRVRQPRRQQYLIASLAESGQQTPIVVVLAPDQRDRYLVIDGHKRIAALQQLGRYTVEATLWAISEAEAVLLDRSMRFSSTESELAHCCRLLTGPRMPDCSANLSWRCTCCVVPAGGRPKRCRRWMSGGSNKRNVRSKARAGNWTV